MKRAAALIFLLTLAGLSGVRAQKIRSVASLGPGGGGGLMSAAIHNSNPEIMLVGVDVGGVYKTDDGGASWRYVNAGGISRGDLTLNVYFVDYLLAHPTDDNLFFACTLSALFRSEDVGETWTQVLPAPGQELAISWMAFSPRNPDLALVGTGGWHQPDVGSGIFRTTDRGRTFEQAGGAGIAPEAAITSIAWDPDGSEVWASTTAGLFRSSDDGDTFARVDGGFRHDGGQWAGIAGSGAAKRYWYVLYVEGEDGDAGSWSGGVYESSDGTIWSEVIGQPHVFNEEDNEIMRSNGGFVHQSSPSALLVNLRTEGGQGGLYRYDGAWSNLTATFSEDFLWAYQFAPVAPECVVVWQADANRIFSCNELAPLLTTDGGASWTQLATRQLSGNRWVGRGAEVIYAYDLSTVGGVLYAAWEDVGFWKSGDRGGSWREILWPGKAPETVRPDGAGEIVVHPSDSGRFYLTLASFSNNLREGGVRSELHKSNDGGTTTSDVTPPSPAALLGKPALAVSWGATPDDDLLYCAFHGDTLYKSTDGGATWNEASSGFAAEDRQMIGRLVIDPADTQVAYAGLYTFFGAFASQGGIYRTNDGGASWSRLEGYAYQDVLALHFAGDPARLFAGGWTVDEGALMVSDDGTTFATSLDQPFVTDIIDVPNQPGTLLAASSATFVPSSRQTPGIYRSTDNGQTWTRFEGLMQHNRIWDMEMFADDPNRIYLGTEGDGVVVAEIDDLKRNFAQFGDGQGLQSTLVLVNPSAERAVAGTVRLFDASGGDLSVTLNGAPRSGEFPVQVPARGVAFFTSDGSNDPVVTGSVEVEADGELGGTILFFGSVGVAGVGSVEPQTSFLVPVESNAAAGVGTGIALSNPGPSQVEAALRLRSSDGTPLPGGEATITLEGRSQSARFADQIFTQVDFSQFQGTVEVSAPSPLLGMAIRQSPGQFATLPVTGIGFARERLHFAQFGDGQGLSSTLILVNPWPDRTASGTVRLVDDDGNALSVDLNGVVAAGEFSFSIPALGAGFFATDGEGDTTVTGSVEVESDVYVGGTILFTGGFGVAGVGAAVPAPFFFVPVETDSGQGVSTGVAVANPSAATVEVTLRLWDSEGNPVPGGTATATLPARGKLARFPDQIFAGAGIDFSSFRGTLEVASPIRLAGMAIRVSPGEFSTLPVTPVSP